MGTFATRFFSNYFEDLFMIKVCHVDHIPLRAIHDLATVQR